MIIFKVRFIIVALKEEQLEIMKLVDYQQQFYQADNMVIGSIELHHRPDDESSHHEGILSWAIY